MKQNKKVLICGAGIAGPTLAFWLSKYGFEVKVIEQAPSLRQGGQNIDVSDAALDVVKMMGVEPLIRAQNTNEEGLVFVDRHGQIQGKFPRGAETSFTASHEILRGDLSQIFYDVSRPSASYVFGEAITELTQNDSAVNVRYRSGGSETFDLLIAADGLGSKTRQILFGNQSFYHYLHVHGGYMTLPRLPQDTNWARWYNAEGGRVLMLRPDNRGTIRASAFFWAETLLTEHFTRDHVIAKLRDVLRGAGWEADRIARDLELDPDIYFGPVSQIRMPTWSKGRCVLVGDSAFCPSPFSGMGSTLAVIGAYVLAGELATNINHQDAFQNYERILRPLVDQVQKLPPGVPRLAYPQSEVGVRLFNTAVGFAASPIVQSAVGLFRGSGKREKIFALPTYSS